MEFNLDNSIFLQLLQKGVNIYDLVELRDEEEFANYLESKGVSFVPDDLFEAKAQFECIISNQKGDTSSDVLSSQQLDSVAGGAYQIGNENANELDAKASGSLGITATEFAITAVCLVCGITGLGAAATVGMFAGSILAAGETGLSISSQRQSEKLQY